MSKSTEKRHKSEPRIGRDELNLCEFPFALVSDRPSKDTTLVLQFQDGAKQWTVSGDPTVGLPTPKDVEVYAALMLLTVQQQFPERIYFCRYSLVKSLGWDLCGKSYDRVLLALRRLRGVNIRAVNAFWDAKAKVWVKQHDGFGIIERYRLVETSGDNPEGTSVYPSWFQWSHDIQNSLREGHIKTLDLDLFLSLRSSITQTLLRYLDRHRYDGKRTYRIGLEKLAFQHLGLSPHYYASQIKRKLDPAHRDLITVGFLRRAEYATMRDGKPMVVYHFPKKSKVRTAVSSPHSKRHRHTQHEKVATEDQPAHDREFDTWFATLPQQRQKDLRTAALEQLAADEPMTVQHARRRSKSHLLEESLRPYLRSASGFDK